MNRPNWLSKFKTDKSVCWKIPKIFLKLQLDLLGQIPEFRKEAFPYFRIYIGGSTQL